jgi:mycofactocin precursor
MLKSDPEAVGPKTADADPAPLPVDEAAMIAADPLVESDLLIEDVSIDGMCGVY